MKLSCSDMMSAFCALSEVNISLEIVAQFDPSTLWVRARTGTSTAVARVATPSVSVHASAQQRWTDWIVGDWVIVR